MYEEEDACHRSLFTIVARAVYEEEDACHRSLFTIGAEPYKPVELIDILIHIYIIIVYIFFILN